MLHRQGAQVIDASCIDAGASNTRRRRAEQRCKCAHRNPLEAVATVRDARVGFVEGRCIVTGVIGALPLPL